MAMPLKKSEGLVRDRGGGLILMVCVVSARTCGSRPLGPLVVFRSGYLHVIALTSCPSSQVSLFSRTGDG